MPRGGVGTVGCGCATCVGGGIRSSSSFSYSFSSAGLCDSCESACVYSPRQALPKLIKAMKVHYKTLNRKGPTLNSQPSNPRFLSSPIMIRVTFFLLFGFNKGALNQKGQKGTTQEPRIPNSKSPAQHSRFHQAQNPPNPRQQPPTAQTKS